MKPREIKERLRAAGFRPSKSLGQNFLLEPTLLASIASDARVGPSHVVLEIGGQPLEGAAHALAAMALARANENVDLVVRRGASTIEVTMPSRLLEHGPFTNWTR